MTAAAAETPNFSSIASISSTTSMTDMSATALMMSSLVSAIVTIPNFAGVAVAVDSGFNIRFRRPAGVRRSGGLRSGGFFLLLVAQGGQGTDQLAGRRFLHDGHQLGDGLVVGRQGRQAVDIGSRDQLAFVGQRLDFEVLLLLGELLEQTGGSARVLGGEGQQGRTHEALVQTLPLSAFEGAACQGVANNTQLDAILAGLLAQVGHLADRDATRIGNYDGERILGRFTDLGNNRLLAFEC